VVSACFDACSVSSSIPQARAKFYTLFCVANLLKLLVARDGIEPPTPAFSGPPTDRGSGLKSTDLIDYNELTSAAL
jgi:hypothetical protein